MAFPSTKIKYSHAFSSKLSDKDKYFLFDHLKADIAKESFVTVYSQEELLVFKSSIIFGTSWGLYSTIDSGQYSFLETDFGSTLIYEISFLKNLLFALTLGSVVSFFSGKPVIVFLLFLLLVIVAKIIMYFRHKKQFANVIKFANLNIINNPDK